MDHKLYKNGFAKPFLRYPRPQRSIEAHEERVYFGATGGPLSLVSYQTSNGGPACLDLHLSF